MNDHYSNGILDEKFLNIENKLETYFEGQNQMLNRIETQTIKTNGRVTELEKKQIKNDAVAEAQNDLSITSRWSQRLLWCAMGALPLLTVWSAWTTNEVLKSKEEISPLQTAAIQAAVQGGILEATKTYAD